jgi:hypothetical protein
MQIQHGGFNIDYATVRVGAAFVGQATISRVPSEEEKGKAFESGYLRSFPTEAQALGYGRLWAEMWCDENREE